MGLETFPEIESFQKLPRQVIVKGGSASFSARDGAELRGIVINNSGSSIRDVRVSLVVFVVNNPQRGRALVRVLGVLLSWPTALLVLGLSFGFAFRRALLHDSTLARAGPPS